MGFYQACNCIQPAHHTFRACPCPLGHPAAPALGCLCPLPCNLTLSAAVTTLAEGQAQQAAAAAREAPEHKTMPSRFYTNALLMLFWQAQLMAALTHLK